MMKFFESHEKPQLKRFFLHSLYFSSWTLIPLIAAAFFERRHEEAYIMNMALGVSLTALSALIGSPRWFYYLTLPMLAAPGMIDIGHIWMFKGRITSNLFFTVFDTNLAEASEFLSDYLTLGLFCCVFTYLGVMIFFFRWCLRHPFDLNSKTKKKILMVALAPVILTSLRRGGAPWYERVGAGSSLLKISTSYVDYIAQINRYKKILDQGLVFNEDVTLASDAPATHILVIGESSNKNHWSLYGYPRETNPLLSKFTDLKVYKKVLCPNPPHTVINIQKLMTFANTKTFSKEGGVAPSILQIAKKAGFKTFWFSNQLLLGHANNMTTVLARQADQRQFVNQSQGANYDEQVLPHFEKAMNDPAPKKLIILHLMGSHSLYKERYPSEFSFFDGTVGITSKLKLDDMQLGRVNAYDNSIRYQDYILSKVYEWAQDKAQTFVYLPDHGEEVFDEIDFNGHTEAMPTKGMYQIPFLFWSRDYSGLTIDLDRKFISENLIHSLTHLYGWNYKTQKISQSLWALDYVNDVKFKVENTVIEY